MLVDLFEFHGQPENETLLAKQRSVLQAIELLETASAARPLAKRAVAILMALLDSDKALRNGKHATSPPVDLDEGKIANINPLPDTFWSTLLDADLADISSFPPQIVESGEFDFEIDWTQYF